MTSLFKRIWNDKRGNVLVIAGASLPLLVGSVGLATDTIQWTLAKRQLQRAADSAALAGVYGSIQGAAKADSVDDDLEKNDHSELDYGTPVVDGSPTGWTSDPYATKVTLTATKALGFSSLFLQTPPTISATATASVVQSGKYCIISLEDSTASGLTSTGSSEVTLGCGMATNSRGDAAVDVGGNGKVKASPVSAVGGIPASDGFEEGTTIQQYGLKQQDPYEDLVMPASPTGSCYSVNLNGGKTATDLYTGPGKTVRPNYLSVNNKLRTDVCYSSLTLGGTIAFEPGTVVLDGGDLTLGSQANVTATNNTFYFTSRLANITQSSQIGGPVINGGAQLNFIAPTEGTYAGILMMQDRRAIDHNSVKNQINGNSDSFLQGSIYFPKQSVTINGNSGINTDCLMMVVKKLDFSGNATITNDCPEEEGLGGFDGSMIRLVA